MTDLDVFTFGETMALFVAQAIGPLGASPAADLRIGGAESNVAIAMARLGHPVAWSGVIGDDPLGDLVERTLRGQQVDVTVIRSPDRPTGLMVKERRTPHRGRVLYYRSGSAGSTITAAMLDRDLIARSRVLHLTGITVALSASSRDAVESALSVASIAGVPVSFDLNYRAALWSELEACTAYRLIVPRCTVVFASVAEARILVGKPLAAVELAYEIAGLGPTAVVIKDGDRGSLSLVGGKIESVPALEIPVVDTVGAGDAFDAGYLSGLLRGAEPRARLELATAVAAFACMSSGDWEGSPTHADLALLGGAHDVMR